MSHAAAKRPDEFARVAGSPGEAPKIAGLLRIIWPFLLVLFLAGYLTRAAWPVPPLSATLIGAGFLALAGLLAALMTLGRDRLQSFLKGAQGEEWVARILSFLPASYDVYHGVPTKEGSIQSASDYDHIVIGPTGIFLIETKHWEGRIQVQDNRILCDGQEPTRPPIDQVKEAASGLRQDLRTAIHHGLDLQPVLCFVDGHLQDGYTGAAGVLICTSHTLTDIITEESEAPLPRDVQVRIREYLDERVQSWPAPTQRS